jgi:ATP-dependent exoDNAse (exonuclease V) beta subunit
MAPGGRRSADHRQPAPGAAGSPRGRPGQLLGRGSSLLWHVLGFKGLERPAVILALNEHEAADRSRERLYVGLSRARDQLVVCGDPAFVEHVGGGSVLRKLRAD